MNSKTLLFDSPSYQKPGCDLCVRKKEKSRTEKTPTSLTYLVNGFCDTEMLSVWYHICNHELLSDLSSLSLQESLTGHSLLGDLSDLSLYLKLGATTGSYGNFLFVCATDLDSASYDITRSPRAYQVSTINIMIVWITIYIL